MQNMQREAQNRQRGGQESQPFQDFQRSGGDRWAAVVADGAVAVEEGAGAADKS